MNGLDVVAHLRSQGVKPKAVFIDLVNAHSAIVEPLSEHGIVNVEILATDHVGSIDFRPLVGLNVHVYDNTSNQKRQRRVAASVVAVKPALLVVVMPEGATWTVYRRFAGDPPIEDRTTL